MIAMADSRNSQMMCYCDIVDSVMVTTDLPKNRLIMMMNEYSKFILGVTVQVGGTVICEPIIKNPETTYYQNVIINLDMTITKKK